MALSAINIAKFKHWLPKKKAYPKADTPFSMSDIKTRYNNQLMLDRFICTFGINAERAINQLRIAECLEFGVKVA